MAENEKMEVFPAIAERRTANNEQILHLALEIYDCIESLDRRLSDHINNDKEATKAIVEWLRDRNNKKRGLDGQRPNNR